MIHRIIAVALLAAFFAASVDLASGDSAREPLSAIRQSLEELKGFSPDPCGPPYGEEKDWHSSQTEGPLFDHVSQFVVEGLNTGTLTPTERAAAALRTVERLSAEVNAAWPEKTGSISKSSTFKPFWSSR